MSRQNLSKLYNSGLNFDELTKEQQLFFKQHLWNGVGSRDYPIDPPDSIFKGPSIYHDFWYLRGGPEDLQHLADLDFLYRCMDKIDTRKTWWKKPFFRILAYIYYYGLGFLGKKAWDVYPEASQNWDKFIKRTSKYIT